MTSTALDFEDIIDLLTQADDAYFNSTTPDTMTDSEYDRLKKRAFSINPSHVYFSRIGSDVRGGKIKLPYTMGSLDQVDLGGGFLAWCQKYSLLNKSIVITDKLDGISNMLVYRNGELEIAYSRGNGTEGADITRHVRKIKNLPLKIPGEDYMVIRGELIMKNDTFKDNWAGKFKNPRGMVAGTMNRTESIDAQIADIDFIAYEIVATNGTAEKTKSTQLEKLEALGFQVVPFIKTTVTLKFGDEYMTNILKQSRIDSDYELDGIVITAEDIGEAVGQRNSVSLNPEHSCKFKVNDDSSIVTAEVRRVIWEISKSGYLKPRVEIIPVDLFGSTVTYATGFNGKFIRDNGIGPGATIRITKSGTVIPYIVETLTKSIKTDLPDEAKFGKWVWNDNDVEIILADAETNPTVRFKQVLDFVEKLNVELLKESSLSKLFDAYKLWNESYEDILLIIIDLKAAEWEKAIGSNGLKSFNSLQRRLQNLELATFMGAVKYMGVGFGIRKAKALLSNVSEADVWKLTPTQIAMMEGFDAKSAGPIYAGLKPTHELLNQLMDSGSLELVKVVKTSELNDVTVVMTGFRDADLAAEIERRGGRIGSGVSKKTTYLLTMDASSNSGKSKKARDLGVTVMTPDDFKDKYNL
ncbi:DNA ligase [Xanthomonas phage Xoo-sp13]|nr:DNA ligase [Xanthomonas phage Xoo-sp13]